MHLHSQHCPVISTSSSSWASGVWVPRPSPQTVTDNLTSNTNMGWGRKLFKWVATRKKGNTNCINNNPFNKTSIFSPPCLHYTVINSANFQSNRMMLLLSRSQELAVWDILTLLAGQGEKEKKKKKSKKAKTLNPI